VTNLRLDDLRTDAPNPQPRADAQPIPQVADLQSKSNVALQSRWRDPSDLPRTDSAPVQHAPSEDVREDAAPRDGVRLDAIPSACKVALDAARARSDAYGKNAWRTSTGEVMGPAVRK
jgi:hypothetical protein